MRPSGRHSRRCSSACLRSPGRLSGKRPLKEQATSSAAPTSFISPALRAGQHLFGRRLISERTPARPSRVRNNFAAASGL